MVDGPGFQQQKKVQPPQSSHPAIWEIYGMMNYVCTDWALSVPVICLEVGHILVYFTFLFEPANQQQN